MTQPEPFHYPVTPHERRHGPSGYKNYQDYKPWLRDEFSFRCVYCLEREMWHPNRSASFSVDHVVPQSVDPARVGDYDNLVYTCTRCNSVRQDSLALDPTLVGFGRHLQVRGDGIVEPLSSEGARLIALFWLNLPPALRVRKHFLRLLALKQKYPDDTDIAEDFAEAFGYPDDLPPLRTLRPPGGNSREANLSACYHERRLNGELDDVY